MSKIALDVVLLPPHDVAAQAIAISNTLAETSGNRKIVLDGEAYLPHISLCMGAVDETDLPRVKAILSEVAGRLPALRLTMSGIKAHAIPTGEQLAVLEVDNGPELQGLHETIMQKLQPYLSYNDVDARMFVSPPPAEPISVKWVRDFDPSNNSPMAFYPHLTSGFGTYDDFAFPITFTADTLAMCHLGNYCTCRKVLASFTLQ